MVQKCFEKKSTGCGVNMHVNKSAFNNERRLDLAEKLHKPIIKKVKK